MLALSVVAMILAGPPATAVCRLAGTVKLQRDGKPVAKPSKLVAYVKDVPQSAWEPPKSQVTIHQRNRRFSESALVIVKHDRLVFVNDDKEDHSVFSDSDVDSFDFERSSKPQTGQRPFMHAGTIHVQCDIHAEMQLEVLVVRNPFYAEVDPQGSYAIASPLPAGDYELVAWEPHGGEAHAKVHCEGPTTVPALTVDEAPARVLQHKDGSPYHPGIYQ